jgi:subtilisin-like proprotein convertase family protein
MSTAIDDPLFSQQWHLRNTGQNGGTAGVDLNVASAWEDYTGKGVVVAVVDQGVEYNHPDLAANMDVAASFSSVSSRGDGQPVMSTDNHGTAVAGVIASVAGNGLGGVGVAYDATIVSVYDPLESDLDPNAIDGAGFVEALRAAVSSYDVINNSWGYSGVFNSFNDPDNQEVAQALSDAASLGRDGLGTIVVFSAGNDRESGADANSDNLTNSPLTITVAAVDNAGKVSAYSTPGASILVAAPSSSYYYTVETTVIPATDEDEDDQVIEELVRHDYAEIVTTDRMGVNGYNTAPSPKGDYAYDFGGTSSAAPEVSGVVALMLEANPDLGYRDVQDILALTARNVDSSGAWTTNGSTTWNGGGMHTSRDVGYGLVDATAAVRLAETWDGQSTAVNLVTATGSATVGTALADGTGSAASSITLPAGVSVERAGVVLDIDAADASDLVIELTSPSGTKSTLYNATGITSALPDNYSMTSTQFLGESSQGTWTLTVSDRDANGQTVTFGGWTLNLYGSAATADTRYVYTNEYSDYAAADSSRTLLVDAAGTDTLNASPVTAGSAVNLAPGSVSVVDGTPLVISAGTTIENVYTGDGNDLIVDNAASNTLSSGRGNDVILSTWGDDSINGGKGYDVAGFDRNYDAYTVGVSGDAVRVSSIEGVKTVTNTEALSFADRVVPTAELLQPNGISSTSALLAGVA